MLYCSQLPPSLIAEGHPRRLRIYAYWLHWILHCLLLEMPIRFSIVFIMYCNRVVFVSSGLPASVRSGSQSNSGHF